MRELALTITKGDIPADPGERFSHARSKSPARQCIVTPMLRKATETIEQGSAPMTYGGAWERQPYNKANTTRETRQGPRYGPHTYSSRTSAHIGHLPDLPSSCGGPRPPIPGEKCD